MNTQQLLQSLAQQNDSKIILLVMDGLGDLPGQEGKTPLQTAQTPNMDILAQNGACGLSLPIGPGITPGSGPAHLALFGYDPVNNLVGRGILSALGVGFQLQKGDVAARANFCTLDADGNVTDRRAGRIATELNQRLCKLLQEKVSIDGVEAVILPEKEHRAAVIFRGRGLSGNLSDTDPQEVGKAPLQTIAGDEQSKITAVLVNNFLTQVTTILKDQYPANGMLLRGIDTYHPLPSLQELHGLRPCCIATYPMYKGVSTLVGMDVLEAGATVTSQMETLKTHWSEYDFFFIHVKKTDSYGEDGNFEGKTKIIEEVDAVLPLIASLKPDLLIITGDHSTPCTMKGHSWHPVPLLFSGRHIRQSLVTTFDEVSCLQGSLGTVFAKDIMALALAHTDKLKKFGA